MYYVNHAFVFLFRVKNCISKGKIVTGRDKKNSSKKIKLSRSAKCRKLSRSALPER